MAELVTSMYGGAASSLSGFLPVEFLAHMFGPSARATEVRPLEGSWTISSVRYLHSLAAAPSTTIFARPIARKQRLRRGENVLDYGASK
jgi:hypothetical protein